VCVCLCVCVRVCVCMRTGECMRQMEQGCICNPGWLIWLIWLIWLGTLDMIPRCAYKAPGALPWQHCAHTPEANEDYRTRCRQACTLTCAHMHATTPTRVQAIHIHMQTCLRTHTYRQTCAHPHPHAHTCAHAHMPFHASTQTVTRTHTIAHT